MSNIAIIGAGISGLTAGYLLGARHRVTLYEANDYAGGHTATVDVELGGGGYAVDTGFIVFNDRTYPNFQQLLRRIGIAARPTEMSFSVRNEQSGLEYNGHSLNSLFAQRRNLLSPRFHRFLAEITRFNRLARQALAAGAATAEATLGDFLRQHGFSEFFAGNYLLPMVAAIWSASLDDSRTMPLGFFLRFFNNHGLLQLADRPQWYVVAGGSRSYVPHLAASLAETRLQCPVQAVERTTAGVRVYSPAGVETYDEVILACHADQALAILRPAGAAEQAVLSGLAYRPNDVVLHTDTCLLPRARRAWASWNYWLDGRAAAPPALTYNMNILQGIEAPVTFCVTLNRGGAITPAKVLRRFTYAHPVYNAAAIAAQARRHEICGREHVHFCGAYWYNGFHEDGVRSALDVCARFGASL
jgi:hypothetical protein